MSDRIGTNSEQSAIEGLKPHQLDQLAATAALPIAAAFAAAGWTWSTSWGDDNQPYVPNAAQIAIRARAQLAEVELGQSLISGRIGASRFIEDERERADVWLNVSSIEDDGYCS